MTPRTILPAALALLFLAGCATIGSPTTHSPGYQPLDARIFPVTELGSRTTLSVATNRPASVAVFEIVPGTGAALVHPRYGQGGDLHAGGVQWIDLNYVPGRWMYQSNLQVTHGPRYYLLVASTRGLDIERLRASPSAIRSSLGYQAFTSFSATRTIESLVQLAVGDLAPYDYVTDVYVVWPTPAPLIPRYASGLHQRVIQCPTGQLVRWIIECPSVAIVGQDPVDPPPADTAGVRGDPPNQPRPGEASARDRRDRPNAVPRPAPGERVRSVTEEAREAPRRPPAARPSPPARERPRPSAETRPAPPPARERSRPQPETRPAPSPRPAPPPQRDSPPDNDRESPALS